MALLDGDGLWRRGVLVAVAVSALLFGGCGRGLKADYDQAVTENEELRRRVQALETANQACESELERVASQNEQLADALAAASEAADRTTEQQNDVFAGSAPEGVSVGRRGGDLVIAIAGDVLFESGKASLRADARRSLDRIADVLRSRYPNNTIRVEGYTDTDPIRKSGWASNEQLSAERALAVERHLVERGVSNSRVYAAAFGPADPKATKQASRRVEVVVLGSDR